MANYCKYSSSDITRGYLGTSTINLRYRDGWVNGHDPRSQGTHVASSQRFNSTFYNQISTWITEFDSLAYNWLEGGDASHVNWVAHIGVYGHCEKSSTTLHHTGRAFDLARVQLNSGWFVDTNWSWAQGQAHKRRYLAVALYLRRYFKTVLTAYYNSAHGNHIHVDNGSKLTALSTSSKADVVIIQTACNLMNGEALTVNGTWNTATKNAFNRLLAQMDLSCLKVLTNLDHTKVFLGVLANDAMNNVRAGSFKWGVC